MIGILIPAHNEQDLLAQCLQAALTAARHPELNGEAVKVTLVLDSCSDGSADIAANYDIKVLQINARNVGIAAARSDKIAFCDDDDCVGARWVDAASRSLDAAEAELLRGLQGQSAADWLAAQGEAALPQAVAHVQRWVVDGLLVAP